MSLQCAVEAEGSGDIVVTVENTGQQPVELQFTDGQTIEVVVTADGRTVWRYSDGTMFTQALRQVTLDPGEQLVEQVTWEPPQSGTYTVEAWPCTTDADCRGTTTIEV